MVQISPWCGLERHTERGSNLSGKFGRGEAQRLSMLAHGILPVFFYTEFPITRGEKHVGFWRVEGRGYLRRQSKQRKQPVIVSICFVLFTHTAKTTYNNAAVMCNS